jgi:uncharacterized protein (TIGR02246 family)
MKVHVPLAAALVISVILPTFAKEKSAVDLQTRQQLEAIYKLYDAVVNKNDAAAVAAFFTEDAVLVTPLGVFSGRAGVEKYNVEVFRRWNLTDSVSRLDQVYALGDDLCAIGNYTIYADSTLASGDSSVLWTHVGDTWKIRAMVLEYPLGPDVAQTSPPTKTATWTLAQTPSQGQTATPALAIEATPTPTLGDNFTQVLPDRRVTFRFAAPNANAVSVLVGVKSGVDEPQGSTNSEMAKDSKGLWTVTLGPFEPNLYEYHFSLDGRKITDPGNDMPKPQRHVDTSLLLLDRS